jgi:ferritin-like metal-binding protein YciE
MKLNNLNDLFILEIQDLYDGEKQITQAIPQLAERIQNTELKRGMLQHLEETRQQMERLEDACKELGIDPNGKTCVGMEGIIEEAVELMQENVPSPTLDAGLLGCAQKVEHYEIAGYGTATTYAKILGYDDLLETLHEILEEEKATDEKLTKLAEQMINLKSLEDSPKAM